MLKVTKKFYVGKPNVVNSEWTHSTLAGAIEHGKNLASEQEEDQIIVQVVRVIRVQKRPVIVEKV